MSCDSFCLAVSCHIHVVSKRKESQKVCRITRNYANASSTRGSFLLSRLANYHPERFLAYVFIDHGYSAPGRSLTTAVIRHINSSVQAKLGFSIFGYFLFFNEEDAPKLLNEHVSSR
jgi:S-adenosylmethionine hydrolase